MRLVIYEWDAWYRYMLVRTVPEAVRLTAQVGESADQVLARCPSGVHAFAFHLNATFTADVPQQRHDLIRGLESLGIVPLNARVVDISKRGIQAQCLSFGLPVVSTTREGDPDELLITKTNHNFGGRAERQGTAAQLPAAGVAAPSKVVPDWTAYRVTPRRQVPDAWWDDLALTVERYIDNRQRHFHRVCFAGDRFVILRLTNLNLLKKIGTSTERLDIFCRRADLRSGSVVGLDPSVARTIVQYLDGSGMDFGALEVVADDEGRAYVIDVNSTSFGANLNLRILMQLRRGIIELISHRGLHSGRRSRVADQGAIPTLAMLIGDAKRITNWHNARE